MSMSNSSNPSRGVPSNAFGNASILNSAMLHKAGFGQSQGQGSGASQNQFQLSQAQAIARARAQAQAQAQGQAAQGMHPQFQARLQASLNQMGAMTNFGSPSQSPGGMPASGSGGIKQPPQRPPMRPPGVPIASTMSPMIQMELAAAARKKQKVPDRQGTDRVAAILPESALYTQLLEFEARVDSALMRKKMDIQEALKSPPLIQKTMRIYVFNTFADQVSVGPQKPSMEPPTWTLKIVGRILDEGGEPDQPGAIQKSNPMYPKFSAFFKRITIQLDQRLYPDNPIIVWENSRSSAPQEGFEVKRKGDKEFTAAIRLEMNYMPEKFKLSPPLMEVLGIEVETRPRIITAIWHYVKARKLQNLNDPSFFYCDPPLQKVFGEDRMKFTMVSQRISPHLSPPQPIHLEHKIKLSGHCPVGTACYDVLVDVPIPIQRELLALLANVERNKEIDTCDEAIHSAIRKIHEHRKRRAFFLGFSQSPIEFTNALIESQSKDLKLVAGEANRSAEKERRSEFFNQPWVEDAVIRYLNRKPPAGSDAPPPST
ncbi:hypothetical protein MLD38_013262 [Melastoma candidum]|uniref:Uncharacterized protein n=1 Tax=Melastoma candidum TaxID=119954 RepID=A0ACB9R930_9MYRT|nr:hypothetical protein MLD38_013262 [Melastoma candidum]